jgi:hypothetical protein
MLNSFARRFDYAGFEKKIKHYFTDSAPINADIDMGLRDIRVSCQQKAIVSCEIDDTLSVKQNVKNVISACTENLYPKMIVSEQTDVPFTGEQKKALLFQGFSVEQMREKEQRRTWTRYTIIRFNEYGASLDYIEESTGARYRAHLYRPLALVKEKIWKLGSGGRKDMEELYRFLMSASKQEIVAETRIGLDSRIEELKQEIQID